MVAFRFMLLASLFAALLLVAAAQPASAKYVNASRYYTLDIPAGWTQQTNPGGTGSFQVDASFQPPAFPSTFAYVWVLSFADPNAKNSTSYLLGVASQVQSALTQSSSGVTIITQAQGRTIANRPAADLALRVAAGATSIDVYAVLFSSEYHKFSYELLFYSTQEIYAQYKPTWDSMADSFRVTDEQAQPAPAGGLSTPLLLGLVGAIVAAVVIVVAVVLARRRRPAALPPIYPPQGQVTSATAAPMPGQPPMGKDQGGEGPQDVPPPPEDMDRQ